MNGDGGGDAVGCSPASLSGRFLPPLAPPLLPSLSLSLSLREGKALLGSAAAAGLHFPVPLSRGGSSFSRCHGDSIIQG
ncbi:Hypothetical predicted protein [Podarcis lilfordi]|uniref:Uncharacterized protein n=1 Tax=Podarcis lilfordi TaxID=74358 RepID=A0AA35PN29_9SAUR|nr:Hypothetical predicted protein [Podarcis lilfordi]